MTTHEYTNAYTIGSDRVRAALLTARLAAHNRTTAAADYQSALVAAHRAGASYAELSAVLGVTRQAIRQYLNTN